MFDWGKIVRNMIDRIDIMFGITDPKNEHIYSKRFQRTFFWFGHKVLPAFMGIVSLILLFWIFFRIYGRSGFEKTVIILLVLIMVNLRGNT